MSELRNEVKDVDNIVQQNELSQLGPGHTHAALTVLFLKI